MTIWLKASPREHFQRVVDQGDMRPMTNRPRAMAELEAILQRRDGLYSTCDAVVDTAGQTAEQSLRKLVELVKDT
jgi:XRE family aerobic/anaerobic benzoate catabolism transcriptional regulator